MIIEHTTIKFHSRREHIDHAPLRKESKPNDPKKPPPQANYNSLTQKQTRSKHDTPLHQDKPDTDTYRELLSKRERNRETQSRLEHRHKKAQDNPSQRNTQQHNKSYSKSKSREKSKGIAKSRSLKQLGKKSKSMVRLQVREVKERKEHHIERTTKEERKSDSPHRHAKSTMSIVEKKNYKSNYVSKTNREYTSEITTDRDKSKGKLKMSQISKPSKKQEKLRDFKKKSAPKIVTEKKKTLQKENTKNEKKPKPIIKVKKEKKVIMSQENSKFRRNEQQWESSQNQDEFLDPKQRQHLKQKKGKHKQTNMVEIPKRKQRLSLNANSKRYFKVKNTKTEAQAQVEKERMKDKEQWAATTIQKVFRGYLTRKYIRECFQHNAAVNIQRVWRGHRVRLQLEREKKRAKGYKILQHEQYLLQKSSSREDSLRNSNIYAQKWASILEQILSQQSVNSDIKKKIELFLQRQRKEMSEFDYRSNRSSSAKSNISSQVISNEINSEKHFMQNFIQQEKRKKMYPNMQVYVSPTSNYRSPKRYTCTSPQGFLLNSPTYHLPERQDESQELTSSEMLITHLKSIQRFHKERLQTKAKDDREELNKLLIKNMLTPRTHEKKYKQVEQVLQSELEKFNESINEIVKNCILYKESPNASRENKDKLKRSYEELMEFNDDSMITPKKELLQLQVPFEMPEECLHSQKLPIQGESAAANFKRLQEKSQEFHQYYKTHHQQKKQPSCQECFDTSYQFIEEYLINLIDFMRQYEGGCYVSRVLSFLHKPRSHQVPTIIHNMSVVTEGSEQDDLESSFKLPLYKYIELDEQIIQPELIEAFHLTFPKIGQNELQECFVKMVVECMNQALNSLRPTSYIFSQTQLSTLNYLRSMQRVPLFQSDNSSQEEMQYQFMLAQTLNKIFYWNKLEWGKMLPLRAEETGDRLQEMKDALERQQQAAMVQLCASEQWEWYQQLVQIISQLSEELFVAVLFEEVIEVAWNTGSRRNNPKQHLADIRLPDNAHFYQD